MVPPGHEREAHTFTWLLFATLWDLYQSQLTASTEGASKKPEEDKPLLAHPDERFWMP